MIKELHNFNEKGGEAAMHPGRRYSDIHIFIFCHSPQPAWPGTESCQL